MTFSSSRPDDGESAKLPVVNGGEALAAAKGVELLSITKPSSSSVCSTRLALKRDTVLVHLRADPARAEGSPEPKLPPEDVVPDEVQRKRTVTSSFSIPEMYRLSGGAADLASDVGLELRPGRGLSLDVDIAHALEG